jgi:hypothetical protein
VLGGIGFNRSWTASRTETGQYTSFHIFVLNVFNVGYSAEGA